MFIIIKCKLQYLCSLFLVLVAAHTKPLHLITLASPSSLSPGGHTWTASGWHLVPQQDLEVSVSGHQCPSFSLSH